MSEENNNEPLLDMFLFETVQLLEQLEQSILSNEQEKYNFSQDTINEIFRIMHTIKGSSAMMMLDNISALAHTMEDIFYYLREEEPFVPSFTILSDLVLDGVDFIKNEIEKIKNDKSADGDSSSLIDLMKEYLLTLKESNESNYFVLEPSNISYQNHKSINTFKAVIYFEEGCEMENIRAYTVIRNLRTITDQITYIPEDIIDNDDSIDIIRQEGFSIFIKSDYTYDMIYDFLMQTIFLKDLELIQLENDDGITFLDEISLKKSKEQVEQKSEVNNINRLDKDKKSKNMGSVKTSQSMISVSVTKLDKLMDLIGEMVIVEAMVVQNPDLKGLELDNFQKAARQLNKITTEMQDMVMSIRMVPLSATFNKMHRIVRDMSKKLEKEVKLEIIGDTTEVDKNIIEHISDPLMHIVRNAIDHGIESSSKRLLTGKPKMGHVTLEAKNSGSDVLIIIKDDGKGLDKVQILKKAKESNLLVKDEDDMTDREIFNLILLPGFSTNDEITEFSGRGVGMDVVAKNIEEIGGTLLVDSIKGKGTQITLKIPLTLAIIDGMNIRVGNSSFTLPMMSIKESFRPNNSSIFSDTNNNEMIMVRGQCYPIIRLHSVFGINTSITNLTDGIIIMVEQGGKISCLFADELLGQQQVVVKTLPEYIQSFKTIRGLSGCTLLGDGSISLIVDVAELVNL